MPPATSNPSPLAFHKQQFDNGRIVTSSFIRLSRQQPILNQSTSRPCRHHPQTLRDDPHASNHQGVHPEGLHSGRESPTSSFPTPNSNNNSNAIAVAEIVLYVENLRRKPLPPPSLPVHLHRKQANGLHELKTSTERHVVDQLLLRLRLHQQIPPNLHPPPTKRGRSTQLPMPINYARL
jgi:hypothetical protein